MSSTLGDGVVFPLIWLHGKKLRVTINHLAEYALSNSMPWVPSPGRFSSTHKLKSGFGTTIQGKIKDNLLEVGKV